MTRDRKGEDMIQPEQTSPALKRVPMSDQVSDIGIEDWDDLLNAVKERLRLTVGKWQTTTPEPPTHAKSGWVQASVLECVAALDQLQLTFMNERRKHQQLELRLLELESQVTRLKQPVTKD